MRFSSKWTAICGVLLCGVSAAWGQLPDVPAEKPVPAFPQIFPKPTGNNGYEDFVMAGDIARQQEVLGGYDQAAMTLGSKRRYVTTPESRKALQWMYSGMNKPIEPPQRTIDENTLFPELAGFRALARLVNLHIYVSLADGQINAALDDLQAILRLGYHVQATSFITGLVGIAVDAIGLNAIARHIPQFSVRDCDRLILMMTEWLKIPPPEIKIIVSERDAVVGILQKNRRDNQKLHELLVSNNADDEAPIPPSKLKTLLENLDTDTSAIVDSAVQKIAKLYNDSIENLKLPYWKRTQIQLVNDGSAAYQMAEAISMTPSTVSDRYAQIIAQMHLLAVHAAIRKYRWEYERLPKTLDELKRERDEGLLTDPFTGEYLIYKPSGEQYELYSVGIPQRDEQGKIIPGSGTPIYLPRRAR